MNYMNYKAVSIKVMTVWVLMSIPVLVPAAVNIPVDNTGNYDLTVPSEGFSSWAVNNAGVATNFTTFQSRDGVDNTIHYYSGPPNPSTYNVWTDQQGTLKITFSYPEKIKTAILHVCSSAFEYSGNSARNRINVIAGGITTQIYQQDAPGRWSDWGGTEQYIYGTTIRPSTGVFEYDIDITPLVIGKTSFQLEYLTIAGYSAWRNNGGVFYRSGNGPFRLKGMVGATNGVTVPADEVGGFNLTVPSENFTSWALNNGGTATNFTTFQALDGVDYNNHFYSGTPSYSTYGVWNNQQGVLTLRFDFPAKIKNVKLHVCSSAFTYPGNSARNVISLSTDGVTTRIYQHDAPDRWPSWGGTEQYIFGTTDRPTTGVFEYDVDITPLVAGKTSFQLEYSVISGYSTWRCNGGAFYRSGNGPFSLSGVVEMPWKTLLSRGHRLLVQRGLQLCGSCSPVVYGYVIQFVGLSLDRYFEANFTTVNFVWSSIRPDSMACLGAAPGVPWGRLTVPDSSSSGAYFFRATGLNAAESHNLYSFELPYQANLVNLQYKDEQDMTNPLNIQAAKSWFDTGRQLYPDTLLYTNQAVSPNGGVWYTVDQLKNYMAIAQPDMLMCDFYPFNGQVYASVGGFYYMLQLFRQAALAGLNGNGVKPIPYGLWLQGFVDKTAASSHGVSESEIRLNQFSAWAFGYKFAVFLGYNDTDEWGYLKSVLFDGIDDTCPTPSFYHLAETNRQSKVLGPALVRLISRDVRMLMGHHYVARSSEELAAGLPEWEMNSAPANIPQGIAGVSGSYITSISYENLGTFNHGLPGDLIIGFFSPLHEAFDGSEYSNQEYFMITNGLTDPNGSVLQTGQRVRVDFDFSNSGITSIQRLNRYTNQVEVLELDSDGGSKYHLYLDLGGGEGDLFKYNTGAPFVDRVAGDANGDGKVDVGDLGILAANYGMISGATWDKGDFNHDGKVDVSDLGILAANYGTGTGATLDFNADAKALGLTLGGESPSVTPAKEDIPFPSSFDCGSAGLPLIAGFVLLGLMFGRMEE